MRTIYKMRPCGHRMWSCSISVGEDIPLGWYESEEIAEVEFRRLREHREIEYDKMLPRARKILAQKKMKLMATIANLGCDVFTGAEVYDDREPNSWLTLEISLIGEFGSYSYSSKIDI